MLAIFKYILFLLATVLVCALSGKWIFLPFCIAELALLFVISAALAKKNPKAGYLLNVVLLFIYSAQLYIYYFTGEFISMLMLENVDMTASLGNSMVKYVLTALPFIALLFLPARVSDKLLSCWKIWGAGVVLYLIAAVICTNVMVAPLSPFTASAELIAQSFYSVEGEVSVEEKQRILEHFYCDSIPSTEAAPLETASKNVVLMMTEGLSAEVLDVYNDLGLNLTPNLDKLHSESFVVDNYFNHTAATFRAVRGQLYSGYQSLGGYYNDGTGLGEVTVESLAEKMNVSTISIVDILNEYGYNTCYVNSEPYSEQIKAYAKSFGVDTLVSGNYDVKQLSDRQAFDVLAETVLNLQKKTEPYLVIFYNIGTHHGFDSPDVKYADATNPDLNKFHNYDHWFGDFFEKMRAAGVWENTLLVFTADHASYPAPEFKKTFRTDREEFIGRIPLFFYSDDVSAGSIDACGRNSLDMAPTLLDILGFSSFPNYFLGTSLFLDAASELSYMSAQGSLFHCTRESYTVPVSRKDGRVKEIEAYYKINMN